VQQTNSIERKISLIKLDVVTLASLQPEAFAAWMSAFAIGWDVELSTPAASVSISISVHFCDFNLQL
jgi:hypothetical protein